MPESVVRARSEVEAAWMLAEGRPGSRVIAGGTDVMTQMERGIDVSLVDIRRAGMSEVTFADDVLRLGACVTVAALSRGAIRHAFPAIAAASDAFSSIQVRNMATLGGSIGSARAESDLLPCMLAHDVRLVIREGDARRTTTLPELLVGPRRTRLQPRELLCEIHLPRPPASAAWTIQRHERISTRAGAPPLVALCLLLRLSGDDVEDARIALGGVAPTVVRARQAEQLLVGKKLSRDAAIEAARLCSLEITPRDDGRVSAAWRREVVRRTLGTMLLDVISARAT